MITVHLRNLGMTPQKIRLIAKLIRGKKADEAILQLQVANKRSSLPMLKLLKSGIDAAKRKDMDEKSLVISELIVNEGPKRKRGYAMSRGHVGTITKRSSHISLTLSAPVVVEKEKAVRFTPNFRHLKDDGKYVYPFCVLDFHSLFAKMIFRS